MENKTGDFMSMFGARVRDLRTDRGWTQVELAERMAAAGYRMHQTTITKLEGGSRPTSVDELAALAVIFGVPATALVSENGGESVGGSEAVMAALFDRWDDLRQESVRAAERRDEAFEALARFVQEHHSEALEGFWNRARQWAEREADAEHSADLLHATLVARAVPVAPFKELEDSALKVHAAKQAEKS